MNKFISYFFLLYCLAVEPYLDRCEVQMFVSRYRENDPSARLKFYISGFCRNAIMGVYVLCALISQDLPFSSLGLKAPTFQFDLFALTAINFLIWLVFIAYLSYFYVFPLLLVYFSSWVRERVIQILEPIAPIMPRTNKEYLCWCINGLNAATEELVYRGFVFLCIQNMFPGIPISYVIIVSVFLDCFRYFPRFAAMRHVAATGIIYATSYVLFDSLYAPIFLHVTQDLCSLLMPVHLTQNFKTT